MVLKVLNIPCDEGALATDLAQRMRQRRHSGFSVHKRIRSKAADAEGRQRLARYMIRCPLALRMSRLKDEACEQPSIAPINQPW